MAPGMEGQTCKGPLWVAILLILAPALASANLDTVQSGPQFLAPRCQQEALPLWYTMTLGLDSGMLPG